MVADQLAAGDARLEGVAARSGGDSMVGAVHGADDGVAAGAGRRLGIHSTLICHNVLPHERSRIDALVVGQVLSRADQLIVHTRPECDRARILLPTSPLP